MPIDAAMRYGSIACGNKPPAFVAGWERASRACRSILGQMLIAGEAGPPASMSASDRALLAYLAGASDTVPAHEFPGIELPIRAIYLFGTFDSPVLDLREDRLAELVAPCLGAGTGDTAICKDTYLTTLLQTGRRVPDPGA